MRAEEDWSITDLDALLDASMVNLDESMRCHEAGASRASLVMLAGAAEALLLGMVVAHEDDLRAAGCWPPRPSHEHLVDLARLARRMRWLSTQITDEVIEILNKARTMAAHPGAYVRGTRNAPDVNLDDSIGYTVVYEILAKVNQELSAAFPPSASAGLATAAAPSDPQPGAGCG